MVGVELVHRAGFRALAASTECIAHRRWRRQGRLISGRAIQHRRLVNWAMIVDSVKATSRSSVHGPIAEIESGSY